jgi:putative ABC transport system permease protein
MDAAARGPSALAPTHVVRLTDVVSFLGLIAHNVGVKKVRLALTTLAIAIGVLSVVSLGVVTHSLETSALAIMQTGQADFTIAQKGVADIINSSIDAAQVPRIVATPGVSSIVGVLIGTTKLDANNPQFLEIGIDPAHLERFGVTVVQGRPFTASATDELMLGWRAAENLGAHIGDGVKLDSTLYRVVGIYSTGQSLGDAGAMLPLTAFQTAQRQPGQYTLLFVQVAHGADVQAIRNRIESENPQLITIRTVSDFGRADRSLSLIRAADQGSAVLAIVIGAVVVMSAMSMSFVERVREFGVLAAVGWSRPRVLVMILGEALTMGLLGAAVGSALSFAAVVVVQNLPSLAGVLHPEYTPAVFGRALYTAAAMSLLGALYPALRAALTSPLEALRHE